MIYTIKVKFKFFGIPFYRTFKVKSHKIMVSVAEDQQSAVLIPPALELINHKDEMITIPHILEKEFILSAEYTQMKFSTLSKQALAMRHEFAAK